MTVTGAPAIAPHCSRDSPYGDDRLLAGFLPV